MTTYQKLVQRIHEILPEARLMDKERAGNMLIQEPHLEHVLWALRLTTCKPKTTPALCLDGGLVLLHWASYAQDHLLEKYVNHDKSCGMWQEVENFEYDITKSLPQQKEETLEFILNLLK